MKKFLFAITFAVSLPAYAQKDLIIFRDGTEKNVQITQVNSDKTLYKEGKGKKALQQIAENANIYMIKYEKRGNVFFAEDGSRFTGDAVRKLPKECVLLYLKKGQEVLAYNFAMESRIVHYKEDKKKKSPVRSLSKSEIFMIRYPDGTKDVLINYVAPTPQATLPIAQSQQVPQAAVEEATAPVVKEPVFPAPAIIIMNKDEKAIEAIVTADNGTEIQYKKASNPDGPTYKAKMSAIKKLSYTK